MRFAILFPAGVLLGMGFAIAFYHLGKWMQTNDIQDWQFMLVLAALASAFGLFIDRLIRRI